MILAAALMLCLLAGPALAAEIPDPDFYFNAAGRRYDSSDSILYRYTFDRDPQAAVRAYVDILRDSYGISPVSNYDDGEGMWVLEARDGTDVEVIYTPGDGSYTVYVTAYAPSADWKAAEAWDWNRNAVAGGESAVVTVLPDFLKHDPTGRYEYLSGSADGGEVDIDFNAQDTSISTLRAAEDYVELLISRGYRLIDRTEKTFSDSRTDTWFLQCDERGLDTMDKSNAHAHVRVKRNTYYEWGSCDVEVRFVEDIAMDGYKKGRLTGPDDDDDIFANDCS